MTASNKTSSTPLQSLDLMRRKVRFKKTHSNQNLDPKASTPRTVISNPIYPALFLPSISNRLPTISWNYLQTLASTSTAKTLLQIITSFTVKRPKEPQK